MNVFNPWMGERRPAAWAAVVKRLTSGEWEDWDDLVAEGVTVGNLLPKSMETMLQAGVRAGALRRRDEQWGWMRTRVVRLNDDCPDWLLTPPEEGR